jgi:flagellar biosynthetic protein FlhB
MAEEKDEADKTEEPSLRKLEQAQEKGDVAKSIEVNSWFVLAAFTLAVALLGGYITRNLALELGAYLGKLDQIPFDRGGLMSLYETMMVASLVAVAAPMALGMVAGIAGNMMQHKPVFSAQSLTPKMERISPIAGFKRVFGMEALVQFTKGLLKIGLVSAVMLYVLWPERGRFESLTTMDPAALLPASQIFIVKLMGAVLAAFFFVALADFVYQRFRWYNRQRMTREELKQEFKETEGSPEIKQKIRQLRAQASRRRMMEKVPKASVVIMNPTHYAVALQYERGMPAPVCVAKGVDDLALRIKAVALEHGVAVVENPPLARALHASVVLDQEIDPEHYKAVAEVIGYVMKLRRSRA